MKYVMVSFFLVFVGCALPQKTKNYERSQPEPNKAAVYIYRTPTSVDSVNPDVPRFYVNKEELGKLRIGGYYISIVEPGEVLVYYKDSLFSIPLPWKSQEIHFNAIAGQVYFIKYGTDFSLLEGKTLTFKVVPLKIGESEILSTQLLVN
jgi:hypothetical protein